MSKLRIQQYMEKHKLTPLFEVLFMSADVKVYAKDSNKNSIGADTFRLKELMNKVLHDQPDDPLVYLIKCLYKKAALPIPKDLRPGTLRRSSPERIGRRSKSPEKSTGQAWAVGSGPDLVDRSYDKPWLAGKKKVKEDRAESPPKQGRKQKTAWNSDTKVTATTFDDLFEEDHGHQEHTEKAAGRFRKEDSTDISKAWARNIGLDDGEDVNYRSRGYTGPRCQRDEDDPLAGELKLASSDSVEKSSSSVTKTRRARLEAQKHREELEKLLQDTDKVSVDSGFDGQPDDDVEDDAIELLEDPEELKKEGVTNVSKSGHKLSRILRQRQEEANVKLNINLYTGRVQPFSDYGNQYGDYYESDLERPPTGMSFQSNRYSEFSPDISDEEFESVSQVAGPRKPVWTMPDSDGETQRQDFSRTLPEPRSKKKMEKFSSTVPVRFADKPPHPFRSVDSEKDLHAPGQAWNATQKEFSESPPDIQDTVRDSVKSMRSYTGAGWNIPDDTEVSLATEWTAGGSSAREAGGPPKAY